MAVKTMSETTEIRELSKILALAPVAGSLDDIFVAPTVASDGVNFRQTGREVVTVKNTHSTDPFTFTLVSVADELLRTGDIGAYTLQAGDSVTFIVNPTGFKDSNGMVKITMNDLTVKVAVVRVPGVL